MKLISVNCGLPRKVAWHGRTITTAIYSADQRPGGKRIQENPPPGTMSQTGTMSLRCCQVKRNLDALGLL